MSLIIIVIISALFWTVQKGSELYTTYFKVALLKCHTSCKLVVLFLCIYYTSVFKLQQHSVHFLLLSTFQTWSICVSHKSFLMEKKRNKNLILFHLQSILKIKSFLHTFSLDSKEYTWNQIYFTYITIQSRLQLVGIFYLSEQLSDFFQQLNVKFFEDPKSDNELHIRKKVGSYLKVIILLIHRKFWPLLPINIVNQN